MADDPKPPTRRLESEDSVAARSPVAQHDDVLSPTLVIRETTGSGGGQRLGDGVPVDGPITSFPEGDEDEAERLDDRP